MKIPFRKDKNVLLEGQIERILQTMDAMPIDSQEYSKMMIHLSKLTELKTKQRRSPVSLDTMVIVAGNLLGIVVIVAYEQKHVMTSKAITQLIQLKTPK